jgi:hypothetical protein
MNLISFLAVSLSCSTIGNAFFLEAPIARNMLSHRRVESSLHMFDFLKPKQEPEEEEGETKIPVEQPTDVDFSDDPIDKIFGFFFGKKEEEPMGLKRFGRERFPEQYPAVIDEWAEPVEGDSPDVAALRPLLKNTNLEFRGLKVQY